MFHVRHLREKLNRELTIEEYKSVIDHRLFYSRYTKRNFYDIKLIHGYDKEVIKKIRKILLRLKKKSTSKLLIDNKNISISYFYDFSHKGPVYTILYPIHKFNLLLGIYSSSIIRGNGIFQKQSVLDWMLNNIIKYI